MVKKKNMCIFLEILIAIYSFLYLALAERKKFRNIKDTKAKIKYATHSIGTELIKVIYEFQSTVVEVIENELIIYSVG